MFNFEFNGFLSHNNCMGMNKNIIQNTLEGLDISTFD
jgi:hypothetical protein